jgi:hypothetical protein
MSAKKKDVEERVAKARKKAAPIFEQSRDNVVVDFPQAERAAALPAPVEVSPEEESRREVTAHVELLETLAREREESVESLKVDYDSVTVAEIERGPLLRIFRDQWRHQINYYMSERGGKLTLEDACTMADKEYRSPTPDERFQELMNYSMENVSFDQLMRMWTADSAKAERYFALVKNEAQREFATGHLAAQAFEPVDWMSTVWNRAQFLAVRDSFIAEYIPDGGIEYSLIDMMVQCYFMQQYWMKQTVERTKTDPRRESYEFEQWKQYKKYEAKARSQWDDTITHWEIPYASQLTCIENASRMVALFASLYQKALRQLNAHRMMKFKMLKIKAETRRINALTKQTLRLTEGRD